MPKFILRLDSKINTSVHHFNTNILILEYVSWVTFVNYHTIGSSKTSACKPKDIKHTMFINIA